MQKKNMKKTNLKSPESVENDQSSIMVQFSIFLNKNKTKLKQNKVFKCCKCN